MEHFLIKRRQFLSKDTCLWLYIYKHESKCGPIHVNFMQMRFGIFRPAKRVVTLGGHVGRWVVTLDDVIAHE